MVGRDRLLNHGADLGVAGLQLLELLLQAGDHAVGQLAGTGEVAAPLGLVQLGAALVQLYFKLLRRAQLLLLAFPAGR